MSAHRPATPRRAGGLSTAERPRPAARTTRAAPARASARASKPTSKPARRPAAARRAGAAARASATTETPRPPRQITVRTLVLFVVVLVAFIVLAPTLRAYVAQQETHRELTAQIEEARERNERLEAAVDQWNDDAYVQAQARERLGFVMPGETPYRVVDPETVTGEATEDDAATGPVTMPQTGPWYVTIWDSVQVAGEVDD